jgi:hypothetical protein
MIDGAFGRISMITKDLILLAGLWRISLDGYGGCAGRVMGAGAHNPRKMGVRAHNPMPPVAGGDQWCL